MQTVFVTGEVQPDEAGKYLPHMRPAVLHMQGGNTRHGMRP